MTQENISSSTSQLPPANGIISSHWLRENIPQRTLRAGYNEYTSKDSRTIAQEAAKTWPE